MAVRIYTLAKELKIDSKELVELCTRAGIQDKGSALASIGLTVPAVVLVAALFDLPLVLGLAAKDMVLMTLSFLVGSIALGSGRTNMMQGAVQLVIFAAFLFLSLVP